MTYAFKGAFSGFALLTGLLVACSVGPTQQSGGNLPLITRQTQQVEYPPFSDVSPGDYQAARRSACTRYCQRYNRYSRFQRYWRYLYVNCIRNCMTGEPTDQFGRR